MRRETHDTFTIELEPMSSDSGVSFAPGQFMMLYVFGVGEVPISISGGPTGKGDGVPLPVLVHTVRAVGAVTGAMHALKRGEFVGVRGPFGSRWPVEEAFGNDVVIVAGGIGLAPLRPAVYFLLANRQRYGRITLLYATRTPQDLLYRWELERWRGRFGIDVQVTVDSSMGDWSGHVGVVTRLIPLCGICPIACQMSAVHAMEDAFGVTVDGQLHALRRLIYCGEWIESHTLHVYMLHAPDFLGYPDAIEMAEDHPDVVQRGLQLKKAGNAIVALLGGREIHPINVRVGGFYKVPTRRHLLPLVERLKWARDAAAARMTHNIVVIGVGNPFRGDDGVGLVVAQCLKDQAPAHAQVVEQSPEAFALIELWDTTDIVIVIDAVVSGAQPGTIHRFDAQASLIPTSWFHGSTHAFGVPEAIELARALQQLPPRVFVYGIEAESWEAGVGLSLALEQVVPTVVERILQEVRCPNCP